jgi:cytoplasmic tRNA 2-thiolation protein 1
LRTVMRASASGSCAGTCGGSGRVVVRRVGSGCRLCRACFLTSFENDVLATIRRYDMFQKGERVAIAVSGGKDSTVLASVLCALNSRENLGLDLVLLSVDEGITGYRDDSLDAVRRSVEARGAGGPPLTIVSYKDLYGWAMDDVVRAAGSRNNCTFCGVFRRQAFDRGAALVKADVVATGHNADDVAETVLMNLLRGDIARLVRCASPRSRGCGAGAPLPRAKPFLHIYEKEIVLYAHHARLDYHSTECVYSPGAYRGFAREFLKDLEAARPSSVTDIISSAAAWQGSEPDASTAPARAQVACPRCGFAASGDGLCQACSLLAGLNAGTPRLALRSGGGQAGRDARANAAAALAPEIPRSF